MFDFLIACCERRRAASYFVSVLPIPRSTRAISLPNESFTVIRPPCQVSSSDNSLTICIACASAARGLAYAHSPTAQRSPRPKL